MEDKISDIKDTIVTMGSDFQLFFKIVVLVCSTLLIAECIFLICKGLEKLRKKLFK